MLAVRSKVTCIKVTGRGEEREGGGGGGGEEEEREGVYLESSCSFGVSVFVVGQFTIYPLIMVANSVGG